MDYIDETWWVVMGTSTTHVSVARGLFTECAYLIPHLHICSHWLITKKVKYPEFCMGYIDEM